MEDVTVLPLFPLGTVLFPGQILPLYIFEPRYKLMVNECLEEDRPFGVVLIREGQEVGAPAEPYDAGTTAAIRQVERLADGRMKLLCVGELRFRVRSYHNRRPFTTGEVSMWPWPLVENEALPDQRDQLRRHLEQYLAMVSKATGQDIDLKGLPNESHLVGILAAIALQVPNHEKQMLLTRPTINELIDVCIDLLKRENRILRVTPAVLNAVDSSTSTFSVN